MTDGKWLWCGPGVLWLPISAFGLSCTTSHDPRLVVPPLSRVPINAVSADRLADLVKSGSAKLTDDGFPGPRKADVAEAFHRTVAMNGAQENENFKSALRGVMTSFRDGHEEEGG